MVDMKLKKIIKPLCLFLIVAILFGAFVAVVVDVNKRAAVTDGAYDTDWKPANAKKTDGGYELTVDNSNTALYVDYSNGKFYLEDKQSSKKWYSTPQNFENDTVSKGLLRQEIQSEIILDYIYCLDENSNAVLRSANNKTACSGSDSLDIEKIENGVKVTYDFKNLEIRIRVAYTLKDNVFKATVLADEIEDGTKAYLVNLSLLPYFGAAGAEENGYMFVPDGSGAIVNFNNGIILSTNYDKSVYGDDAIVNTDTGVSYEEDILVPVFGTAYTTGSALMGVITEGDGAASIAVINGNNNSYYNTVYSKMKYRIYSQGNSLYKNNFSNVVSTVTHNDFGCDEYSVSYFVLSGSKANYSGMAEKYRDYLTKEYDLKLKETNSVLAVDIYGAVTEKTTTFGISHSITRVLTDFETAENICKELKNIGVDNLSVRYIGWNNNGVYNSKIMSKANPFKKLGGSKGFSSLAKYIEESGSEFYPVADTVTYTKSGGGISLSNDSAKLTNGSKGMQQEYSAVTFEPLSEAEPWALVKPDLLGSTMQKFISSYKKLGISSLAIAQVGDSLYSDFTKGSGTYRTKSVEYVKEMLIDTKEQISQVAISGGNIYAAVYSDRVFELPISSSGYEIFEYDVPFVQMVLNGYVAYTTPYFKQSADMDYTFLKAVETGSDLLFACVGDDSYKISETRLQRLFSSEFSLWKDEAVKCYLELKDVDDKVNGFVITSHECIGEDIYKVSYSNGTVIYVNYSQEEKTVDGVTVAARGYLVGK